MPLYEYQCKKCKHRFEKIQKFSDKMLKKCPECGGPIEQMVSAPAVQFKGSGWYVTDYAKKGSSSASSSYSENESSAKQAKEAKEEKKDSKSDKDKKDDKPKSESPQKKQKKDLRATAVLSPRSYFTEGLPVCSGTPTTRVRRRGSSSSEISARNCSLRSSCAHC